MPSIADLAKAFSPPSLPTLDAAELAEKIDLARHKGIPARTVVEVDWSATLPPEVGSTPSPLEIVLGGGLHRPLTLRQTIAALRRASEDERVVGLLAKVQPLAAAYAEVQELRAAVLAFRATGKRAVAWAEDIPGTGAYYLATAFDEVHLVPSGSVGLFGLSMVRGFFGETLPWAGVEPDFSRRHEYKSGPELFTRTGLSEPARENVEATQASVLAQVCGDIADARGLTPERVRELMLEAPLDADEAREAGLVDVVGFRDGAVAAARGGAEQDGTLLFLSRYVKRKGGEKDLKALPKVAVVSVTGAIGRGKSGVQPGIPPSSGTGSDTFCAALRQVLDAGDVKALVLRVDSPGGEVIASDVMWREICRVKEAGIPVVVSMATMAASGGYFISAPADHIVANPATLTGSIGVYGGRFVVEKLRERLKLGTERVATDENATYHSSAQHHTPEQQARRERALDRVYDDFTGKVAEGRDMTREQVHEVAKGRVWTGAEAKERGLVDELGGFTTAVAAAKRLLGMPEGDRVQLVSFPKSSALDRLRPKDSSEVRLVLVRWLLEGVEEALVAAEASRTSLRYDGAVPRG